MSEWSRRNFLKGSAGGLGMLVLPSFLVKTGNAFAAPGPGVAGGVLATNLNQTYFAKNFGIDEAIVRRAMEVALSKGGDFADLYFQHQVTNYVGAGGRGRQPCLLLGRPGRRRARAHR